jgi:ribonuclease HI
MYDSEYAAKSVMGQFNGSKNKELITNCRNLLKELDCTVSFKHVKGHSGDVYNDMADKLAKDGANKCSKKRKITY